MERLALENGGSLVGATFGCLLSASRLTAPMESTIEDSPDRMLVKGSSSISHGERFADVVVHRTACMVRVMSCERSSRLVTGAPRLRVRIVADYEFEVHPTSLTATDAGFLVGEALDPPIGDLSDASSIGPSRSCTGGAISQRITVMCIVGLAHANGILEHCAEMNLRSTETLDKCSQTDRTYI